MGTPVAPVGLGLSILWGTYSWRRSRLAPGLRHRHSTAAIARTQTPPAPAGRPLPAGKAAHRPPLRHLADRRGWGAAALRRASRSAGGTVAPGADACSRRPPIVARCPACDEPGGASGDRCVLDGKCGAVVAL